MSAVPGRVGVVAPRNRLSPAHDRSAPTALVHRCRAGDEQAWAELVSRYERLVFGVATGEGLDTEDAADVTQAVFENLFTALSGLRDEERLSSWLYAVARRQSWRVRDRRRREQPMAVATDGVGAAPMLPLEGGGDPAADVDRALSLHDALQELGEPCRSLLIALYFDPSGPSYAEVALRLGRPVGSIGPSRARCLHHLRAVMQAGDWR